MTRPVLRVELSEDSDRTLRELSEAASEPKRTQRRAAMLRLNHRGWTTNQIAEYFNCQVATVRQAIYRWRAGGLAALWDDPRAGRPRQWQTSDMDYVEDQLSTAQSFNSRQLVDLLEQDCNVHLSRRHLSRLLKKRGIVGNAPGTVISKSKTRLPEPKSKQS